MTIFKILIFFFSFSTAILINTHGLSQKVEFEHLDYENGLSQNSVFAIHQDRRGFMWFGTRFGLNRYDGRHFKIFKNDPSNTSTICGDFVSSIISDNKNNIFVGTFNGLSKYFPEKNVFKTIELVEDISQKNFSELKYINVLYQDKKENIWVGTGQGLCIIQNDRYSLVPIIGLPQKNITNKIYCIFEDSENTIWIGTNNGIIRLKQNGKDYYQLDSFTHNSNVNSISDNNISSIVEDNLHNIWIGTYKNGLNLFDKKNRSFKHFMYNANNPNTIVFNTIRRLLVDGSGKIWIGTQDGLSTLDPITRKFQSYKHDEDNKKSLSQNSIHSLYKDNNNTIWIGTYFGGVNSTYNGSFNPFTVFKISNKIPFTISNNVVSSIIEDEKNNFWIGTEGGGLNYLNKANNKFAVYKNSITDTQTIGSNLIKVLYRDSKKNLWIGTHGGGLNLYNTVSNTFSRYLYSATDSKTIASEITSIIEEQNGIFWIGTLMGIECYQFYNNQLKPIVNNTIPTTLKNTPINNLYKDKMGNIWIATRTDGFYTINPQKKIAHYNNKSNKELISNDVNVFFEDSKANIWIGLSFGGVAKYDILKKKFIVYTDKDGLPNNNVVAIVEDNAGNLWLSTNNGLCRFDTYNKSCTNYSIEDGIAGNLLNNNACYKTKDGHLYFGSYNGLTSFYPDQLETNKTVAQIVFTDFKVFNKSIDINGSDGILKDDISFTNKIVVDHAQNVISIEFALLSFIKPTKNKYKYFLQGFDKTWNEISTPIATYTNLSPGSYTLIVKGANNDGVWSDEAKLTIKVLPPLWTTWWAYLLYFLFSASIVFFIVRYFWIRALYRKEHEMYLYKIDFFTNISHEIRTHLTLIVGPLETLFNANKNNDYLKQQLSTIKNNANRLLKLVNELLDFRKAETNHLKLKVGKHNIVSFLNSIYLSFYDLAVTKKITTSFTFDNKDIELYFDEEQMEKVFFNLISNAFKFTQSGGKIDIIIEQHKEYVEINVVDNGRGIDSKHLDNLFINFFQVEDYGIVNTGYGIGLAYSKTIVALHKGVLSVISKPADPQEEGYTCFTVRLIKDKDHINEINLLSPISPKNFMPADNIDELKLITGETNKLPVVLIVEDNNEVRKLISDALIDKYVLIESENGLSGWQKGTEQIPDIIISDIMMPEMDGLTLCTKFKTDTKTSHIPIILLTAKTSHNDQVSGLETGADIYISKPFSIQLLQLNVRNLLDTKEKMRLRFSNQPLLPVKKIAVNKVDEEFLNQLLQIIEENIDNIEFSVDKLSRKVGMSQPILYKKIKAISGLSVNDFIITIRLKKAAALLEEGKLYVAEVAYAVGYSTPKYFSKEFKKQFGKSPREYKQQFNSEIDDTEAIG